MVMVDNLMVTEERKKEIEDNHDRDEKKAKKKRNRNRYLSLIWGCKEKRQTIKRKQ